MTRRVKVYVGSKDMKPVNKEAEVSFDGPTLHGRILNLLPAEVALLRPCSEPWLCICDPVTSFNYHLELLDVGCNFVANPSGDFPELDDPLSQQKSA